MDNCFIINVIIDQTIERKEKRNGRNWYHFSSQSVSHFRRYGMKQKIWIFWNVITCWKRKLKNRISNYILYYPTFKIDEILCSSRYDIHEYLFIIIEIYQNI